MPPNISYGGIKETEKHYFEIKISDKKSRCFDLSEVIFKCD